MNKRRANKHKGRPYKYVNFLNPHGWRELGGQYKCWLKTPTLDELRELFNKEPEVKKFVTF
jgi:hypothetical protein